MLQRLDEQAFREIKDRWYTKCVYAGKPCLTYVEKDIQDLITEVEMLSRRCERYERDQRKDIRSQLILGSLAVVLVACIIILLL